MTYTTTHLIYRAVFKLSYSFGPDVYFKGLYRTKDALIQDTRKKVKNWEGCLVPHSNDLDEEEYEVRFITKCTIVSVEKIYV